MWSQRPTRAQGAVHVCLLGRAHAEAWGGRRRWAVASAESRRVPTGACGASWRNVSWCVGCVVLMVAGALEWSKAGVVQRGDAPGACSGPIWGFGLVSFVLMAGLQLRKITWSLGFLARSSLP